MFAETESENFTTQRKLGVWPTYNSMVPKNIFDHKITFVDGWGFAFLSDYFTNCMKFISLSLIRCLLVGFIRLFNIKILSEKRTIDSSLAGLAAILGIWFTISLTSNFDQSRLKIMNLISIYGSTCVTFNSHSQILDKTKYL